MPRVVGRIPWLAGRSFEGLHLRRGNQQQKGIQILVVIENLRQRQRHIGGRFHFVTSEAIDREVIVCSRVTFSRQPRAQNKKLPRLEQRTKALPMQLQEFREDSVGLIEQWYNRQAKALANFAEDLARTWRSVSLADQPQPASSLPSHIVVG